MKWIKGVIGAVLFGVALGITGCYTLILVPRNVETYDNDRSAREQEESFADTTMETRDAGQVVNNFYIYDDWAGHSYFDPFWTSPYHWRYSSWWGGAFYDPWWDPWPYYGYYGGSPYHRYGYGFYSPLDWYTPGYNDPYWVYMDGNYGPNNTGEKRRPFDRRESVHTRGGLGGGSGFSAVSGSSSDGISRIGKAGETATELGNGTRRIRRTASDGMAKTSSGAGVSAASSDRRIRRTESGESRGSTIKAARGTSGAAPTTKTRSSGSESRVRRGSSTSSSGSSPSHSGSSGSSGGSVGGSSSGSSGGSGRSSSPPASSGGSSSGSSGHRTRR